MGYQEFYGSCGNRGCFDCRPLFDADNNEIGGTDVETAFADLDAILTEHYRRRRA